MPYDMKSKWSTYVGIMTESTQQRNQRWFHIYVPEFMPDVHGDVAPETIENKVSIENVFTNSTDQSTGKIVKTIYADYFGIASSLSVPTMYKGMQVLVLNYGHTDRWYWLPQERDDALKTFEHIRMSAQDKAVANKAVVSDPEDITTKDKEGITDDDTYFMEQDTKYNKRILFRTSATDGEQFRYGIEIDSAANTIRLWDEPTENSIPPRTTRNQIIIESKQGDPRTTQWGKITLQNACGTSILLNDVDLDIQVPRNLAIRVGGVMTTDVVGAQIDKVAGPVEQLHLSTFTQQVDSIYSLTVKDNFALSVVKAMEISVLGKVTITFASDMAMSAQSCALTATTGLTVNTESLKFVAKKAIEISFSTLKHIGEVIDQIASRCYMVKTLNGSSTPWRLW